MILDALVLTFLGIALLLAALGIFVAGMMAQALVHRWQHWRRG